MDGRLLHSGFRLVFALLIGLIILHAQASAQITAPSLPTQGTGDNYDPALVASLRIAHNDTEIISGSIFEAVIKAIHPSGQLASGFSKPADLLIYTAVAIPELVFEMQTPAFSFGILNLSLPLWLAPGSYYFDILLPEDSLQVSSQVFVVQPRVLTVTGSFTAANKVYDGTPGATILENHLALSGVHEDAPVGFDPVAVFANYQVGVQQVVLSQESMLLGDARLFYALSLDGAPTTTAEIFEEYVFIIDGDWEVPANWNAGTVPTPASKVAVLAKARAHNLPVGKGGKVKVMPGGRVNVQESLQVREGAIIQIEPGASLSISGEIDPGPDKSEDYSVIIRSDETGTGSLIHFTPGINGRVERRLSGNSGDWHQLASPVIGQLVNGQGSGEFSGGAVHIWHEPSQSWVSFHNRQVWPTWQASNPAGDAFQSGRGYMVAYDFSDGLKSNPVKTFEGTLVAGEVDLPLFHYASPSDPFAGYNLLGNPYPSSLDWKAEEGWQGREHLEQDASMQGYTMWIWNQEAGQYGVQHSASLTDYLHNGVSRYIAPMQGFWVKAAPGAHGKTLKVDDRARENTDQQWLKNLENNPAGMLKIQVQNNAHGYRDEALVEFGHPSLVGAAAKMHSINPNVPSLYSMIEDKAYSLTFMEHPTPGRRIPLGFVPGQDGEFFLSVTGTEQLSLKVILLDLYTGMQAPAGEGMVFTARKTDNPARFVLIFGQDGATSVADLDVPQPQIYLAGETLYAGNPFSADALVEVYSVSGARVARYHAGPNAMTELPFAHKAGVYVVRLSSGVHQHTTRVVKGR